MARAAPQQPLLLMLLLLLAAAAAVAVPALARGAEVRLTAAALRKAEEQQQQQGEAAELLRVEANFLAEQTDPWAAEGIFEALKEVKTQCQSDFVRTQCDLVPEDEEEEEGEKVYDMFAFDHFLPMEEVMVIDVEEEEEEEEEEGDLFGGWRKLLRGVHRHLSEHHGPRVRDRNHGTADVLKMRDALLVRGQPLSGLHAHAPEHENGHASEHVHAPRVRLHRGQGEHGVHEVHEVEEEEEAHGLRKGLGRLGRLGHINRALFSMFHGIHEDHEEMEEEDSHGRFGFGDLMEHGPRQSHRGGHDASGEMHVFAEPHQHAAMGKRGAKAGKHGARGGKHGAKKGKRGAKKGKRGAKKHDGDMHAFAMNEPKGLQMVLDSEAEQDYSHEHGHGHSFSHSHHHDYDHGYGHSHGHGGAAYSGPNDPHDHHDHHHDHHHHGGHDGTMPEPWPLPDDDLDGGFDGDMDGPCDGLKPAGPLGFGSPAADRCMREHLEELSSGCQSAIEALQDVELDYVAKVQSSSGVEPWEFDSYDSYDSSSDDDDHPHGAGIIIALAVLLSLTRCCLRCRARRNMRKIHKALYANPELRAAVENASGVRLPEPPTPGQKRMRKGLRAAFWVLLAAWLVSVISYCATHHDGDDEEESWDSGSGDSGSDESSDSEDDNEGWGIWFTILTILTCVYLGLALVSACMRCRNHCGQQQQDQQNADGYSSLAMTAVSTSPAVARAPVTHPATVANAQPHIYRGVAVAGPPGPAVPAQQQQYTYTAPPVVV